MLNILIVCNAGMSSGILARKMQDSSNGKATVKAVGVSEYQEHLENVDMILVGPQIRFQLKDIQENAGVPATTIDMPKYGIMDAEGILKDALQFHEGDE
ncbi:PTS sugar transporter subunit IIB [Virgibacillus sp. NKC19-3]|uniref:PTS sugar transporter subunit IIB n=1 Tax=Virgibacillus saliphilus TaxID=2831674 RepID=UPI001C9B9A8A|nr:PTS sugar transporter subunit IIB [Virgibacillus sp. NKC19-3]MBY7141976.1 PTS sugar transporter subunit IIB [Virgibacillus sp. NKC19-3]